MSCCGTRRQALANPPLRPAPEPPAITVERPTPLAYRGESSILVRGPRTGLTYVFGPRRAGALAVDWRDAPPLLDTGWFEPGNLLP